MFPLFGSLIAAVLLVNISHILTGFWGSFLSTNSSEASTPRLSKQQKKMARQKRIKEEKERKKARREHVIRFIIVTTAVNSEEISIRFYYLYSILRFLRLDKRFTVVVMPLSQLKVSTGGCECMDDEDPDISGETSPDTWRMDRRIFRIACDQGCGDSGNVEHGPLSQIMLSNLLPGLNSVGKNIKYVIGFVPVESVRKNPFPFSWTFFTSILSFGRTDAVHSTIITNEAHLSSKYITSLEDGKVIVGGQEVGWLSENVLLRRFGYFEPSSPSRYQMVIVQGDTYAPSLFVSSLFNCQFQWEKMHEFLQLMNHLTFTENDGEEADDTVFRNTIHYLPTPLIIMFDVLFLNEMEMFRTFADRISVSLLRDFRIASAH